MTRRNDLLRQTVSVWMSVLLLALSVAVPVLERAEVAHETAVESEHDPSTCPPAHDHTVCTQVGANMSAPSGPMAVQHGIPLLLAATPVEAPAADHSIFTDGPPSRAPPTI